MNLGPQLKKAIKDRGFTQKEIAEKIGISETALSQIIKEVYVPRKETLDKICELLNIEIITSIQVKNRAEQIFDKNASNYMQRWNLAEFKKTHPTLYDVIIASINEGWKTIK